MTNGNIAWFPRLIFNGLVYTIYQKLKKGKKKNTLEVRAVPLYGEIGPDLLSNTLIGSKRLEVLAQHCQLYNDCVLAACKCTIMQSCIGEGFEMFVMHVVVLNDL